VAYFRKVAYFWHILKMAVLYYIKAKNGHQKWPILTFVSCFSLSTIEYDNLAEGKMYTNSVRYVPTEHVLGCSCSYMYKKPVLNRFYATFENWHIFGIFSSRLWHISPAIPWSPWGAHAQSCRRITPACNSFPSSLRIAS